MNQLKSPIPQIVLLVPKKRLYIKPGAYNLLTDSSKFAWLGTELTTKTHFGSLRAQSGKLKIDKDGGVIGNITIDMQSILVEDLQGKIQRSA